MAPKLRKPYCFWVPKQYPPRTASHSLLRQVFVGCALRMNLNPGAGYVLLEKLRR